MWETWVRSLGQEDPLEKEMALHSSTVAWKITWTEEPCRLQSMGLQRVGHDWAISLSTHYLGLPWWLSGKESACQSWRARDADLIPAWVRKIPWRRKWQPTPVLLPGKFHAQRSLVGYSPWGCKKSDMTEWLHFTSLHFTLCKWEAKESWSSNPHIRQNIT